MDANSTIKLHTGREIPVMGLGTWKLSDNTSDAVAHAVEAGYRMIDTSSDYGTHGGIGKALDEQNARDSIYLCTKVEEDEDAYEGTKRDLRQLEIDRADLILIHRPPESGAGIDLWKGLIRAREDGLTIDIGVSNYKAEQIDEIIDATGEVPVVNQVEWSPFGWSRELLEHHRQRNILIEAYSPLTRTDRLNDRRLAEIAKQHGKSPAQVMIRWNLQLGTIPLPKANKPSHQDENLQVFDFELSEEDMDRLGDLNEHYSALGELAYV